MTAYVSRGLGRTDASASAVTRQVKGLQPSVSVEVIGMLRLRSARQFFGVSLGLCGRTDASASAVTRYVKGLQPHATVMAIGMLRLRSEDRFAIFTAPLSTTGGILSC
jgi:hypothetical protein